MNIERPIYLQRLIDRRHNGMIKIITGLRRSGKSYLLFTLFCQYLKEQGIDDSQIIKLDLENIYNERYRKPLPLLEYIGQRVTDTREYFILIDEIQLLDRFEEVLNTLLKNTQLDVYVTGSNARFLSKDVVTTPTLSTLKKGTAYETMMIWKNSLTSWQAASEALPIHRK